MCVRYVTFLSPCDFKSVQMTLNPTWYKALSGPHGQVVYSLTWDSFYLLTFLSTYTYLTISFMKIIANKI